MWDIKGEDPAAGNDFENGLQLALKKLNAAGGVCGQPVQYQRIGMSGVNPAQAVTAFKQVQDANPDIAIGAGGDTQAVGTAIGTAGIPVLTPDVNENAEFGGAVGSQWLWMMSSDQAVAWQNATKFLVQTLGAKKVGMMGYTIAFGSVAVQAATQELQTLGQQPCATRTIGSIGATDLTLQVLAMKPCDAIINASYPNDNALELRQALQNGITVPTMMNGGITIAETAKLVTGAAIANSYASADCNTLSSDPAMTTYRTDYMAAYGSTPNYLSAITYDATLVAAAAVEKAGTVDKTAVNTAIGQLDFTGGLCTPHYKADGRHSLTHENNILKFNQDGTWAKVATETIPPLAKIGS